MTLAAALLMLTVGMAITRHGAAVTPDSVQYLSAASHLARGEGAWTAVTPLEIAAREIPFAPWPPLFPALLSLAPRVGLPLLETARWINLAFLVLALVPLAALARRMAGPGGASATVAIHALLFYPYVLSAFVWSEPMFLCLSLASFHFLGRGLDRERGFPRELLVAGLLAGAAMLTRYIGIVLILASGLAVLLLNSHRPFRCLLRDLTWFLLPAGIPNAWWLARNRILTGHFFGEARPEGWFDRDRILLDTGRTLLQDWLGPVWRAQPEWVWIPVAAAAAGGILLAAVVLTGLRTLRFPRMEGGAGTTLALSIYAGAFLAAMLLIVGSIGLDPINTRYLSPAYPVLLLLAIGGVRAVAFSDRRKPRSGRVAALAVAVLLLAVPQVSATAILLERAGREDRSLTRPYWTSVWPPERVRQRDPGLVALRARAGTGDLVLSNEWEIVGITTGLAVKPLPGVDAPCLPGCLLEFPGAWVAIREGTRAYRVTSERLATLTGETGPVEPMGRFGDWSLYRIRTREFAER